MDAPDITNLKLQSICILSTVKIPFLTHKPQLKIYTIFSAILEVDIAKKMDSFIDYWKLYSLLASQTWADNLFNFGTLQPSGGLKTIKLWLEIFCSQMDNFLNMFHSILPKIMQNT